MTKNIFLKIQHPILVQFYDVDSMNVVWHGNYIRYFEEARSALFNSIHFHYDEMSKSGYVWPIVDFQIKYKAPLLLNKNYVVEANLIEYENRIKIDFKIWDAKTNVVHTTATSIQVAVRWGSYELEFETPKVLVDIIEKAMKK